MEEAIKTLGYLIQSGFYYPQKRKSEHENWSHSWRKVKTVSGKEIVYDFTTGDVIAVYNHKKERRYL